MPLHVDLERGRSHRLPETVLRELAGIVRAESASHRFPARPLVDPVAFDPASLPPLERRLHGRVSALYASYFQRDPRFDDSHFRAVTGLASHPADSAYLRRLIDFCVSEGFLPTASVLAK